MPVRVGSSVVGVVENINGDLEPHKSDWPQSPPDDRATIATAKRDLATDMLIDAAEPLAALVDDLFVPPHYRLVLSGGDLPAIRHGVSSH